MIKKSFSKIFIKKTEASKAAIASVARVFPLYFHKTEDTWNNVTNLFNDKAFTRPDLCLAAYMQSKEVQHEHKTN